MKYLLPLLLAFIGCASKQTEFTENYYLTRSRSMAGEVKGNLGYVEFLHTTMRANNRRMEEILLEGQRELDAASRAEASCRSAAKRRGLRVSAAKRSGKAASKKPTPGAS